MLNELYHALNPIAFSCGPITIYWYGLAYVVGATLTAAVAWRTIKRWKLSITVDDLFSIVIGAVFGMIIGALLFYCLFYGDGFYFSHPSEIFAINKGGMSFHGGFVGACIGGALICKRLRISMLTTADFAVIGAPLALMLGRCANFVNGELWGKPTNLPWGVVFETGGNIARHPSQLYEAFLEGLVLFVILYVLSCRKKPLSQGSYIGTFAILYGVFRFCIEFIRVPDAQLGYLFGPITMGQLLSIPIILVGIGFLIFAYKTRRPQQDYLDDYQKDARVTAVDDNH